MENDEMRSKYEALAKNYANKVMAYADNISRESGFTEREHELLRRAAEITIMAILDFDMLEKDDI